MTNRTRLAMVLSGLLLGAAAGSASASIATPEVRAVAPIMIQLARHDGRDDGRGRGRGRDDVGCDDHGTDLCAAGGRSRES